MSTKKQFSWMIRPKGFIKLLGVEYELIQKAGSKVQWKFYIASFTILLISFFCFFSIRYAMNLLFNRTIIEIGLSIFITVLFVLMYIFIINTFSERSSSGNLVTLSNVTRVGFIIFMAFLISKPVEVFIYKTKIATAVEDHKQDLIATHKNRINDLFKSDLDKLTSQKEHYTQMNRWGDFTAQINELSARIQNLDKKKETLVTTSESRINRGLYLIFRIQTVSEKYFLAWILSLLFIIFFLLPGYLIYSISTNNEYFKLKSQQDRNIIQTAYTAFSDKYSALFKRYGQEISFYTKYKDPPFNKVLKEKIKHKSPSDFHNKYATG